MAQSSGVMRWGRTTGARVPMRITSTCWILRTSLMTYSRNSSSTSSAVTAGQEDVPHFLMLTDIGDRSVSFAPGAPSVGHTCKTPARAVTTIHATLIGNEKEHAVGVSMCVSPWTGESTSSYRGSSRSLGADCSSSAVGTLCLKNGIVNTALVDECSVVGCDGHAKSGECADDTRLLFIGEMNDLG